jgi:hypothetical protein
VWLYLQEVDTVISSLHFTDQKSGGEEYGMKPIRNDPLANKKGDKK